MISGDIRPIEDGGVLERLVLSLGHREQDAAQVLAQVVARRADEVADVLDEQEVQEARSQSTSAVLTISASRWQTVPVVICCTRAPERPRRCASRSVARSPTSARDPASRLQLAEGRFQQRRLAGARAGHQADDVDPGRAEPLAQLPGQEVVLLEDALTDLNDSRLHRR